jgi:hypothetical protein
MFVPGAAACRTPIDAIIDDEASRRSHPVQIQAFKDAMARVWRTLARHLRSGRRQNNVPVTRRASFAFVGVPFYDAQTDTVTLREFSINTYLESEADDASPLHEVTAEALRDPIADALDAWDQPARGLQRRGLRRALRHARPRRHRRLRHRLHRERPRGGPGPDGPVRPRGHRRVRHRLRGRLPVVGAGSGRARFHPEGNSARRPPR